MHLNFALKWWDSFICGCICQKNMITKLARDHVFNLKTLSFHCAFVHTFRALFSFFAFCANFAFCQSRLRHCAFLPFCCFVNFSFWVLLPLANNTVIKAGVRKPCKVLTESRSEHFVILLVMLFSQANAQLRLNIILADASAKLANNTVRKVNQDIDVLFCFLFMRKPFNPSLT